MAESKPLINEIRASTELTIAGETPEAVETESGRAAETPRLDMVPIKKFPMFFISYDFKLFVIELTP
jgi:hypothetical protein